MVTVSRVWAQASLVMVTAQLAVTSQDSQDSWYWTHHGLASAYFAADAGRSREGRPALRDVVARTSPKVDPLRIAGTNPSIHR